MPYLQKKHDIGFRILRPTLPIDVGNVASDRPGSSELTNHTRILIANPANADGIINVIEVWAATDFTNFKVGIFYQSGAYFYCRSAASIGTVTAGSKQTFPVSLDVCTGDLLGYYYTTGAIEATIQIGLSGQWAQNGDYVTVGAVLSPWENLNTAVSLYGTGFEEFVVGLMLEKDKDGALLYASEVDDGGINGIREDQT